jgi:hypothetical protein
MNNNEKELCPKGLEPFWEELLDELEEEKSKTLIEDDKGEDSIEK